MTALRLALLRAWWGGAITAREAIAIRRAFIAHGPAVEILVDLLAARHRDALHRLAFWLELRG